MFTTLYPGSRLFFPSCCSWREEARPWEVAYFVGFFICVGVCVFMYIVAGSFCGIFFLCTEFFCALRKQILSVWDNSTSWTGPLAKAKREVVETRSKMTEIFAILCWVSRTTDGKNPDMLIFYHTPVILHSVRASEFLQCLIFTVFCFLFFSEELIFSSYGQNLQISEPTKISLLHGTGCIRQSFN